MRSSSLLGCLVVGALFAGVACESREDPEPSPSDRPPSSNTTTGSGKGNGAPPISGGTLLITRDLARAVVADPDRDRVVVVNLESNRVLGELALDAGSEPGRAVEDADGRVHVVLRRGDAVLTLSRDGSRLGERSVCEGPRGIGYDEENDQLLVACVGGELERYAATTGGARVSRANLGPDLRDVVVSAGRTFVSRFRSAQILLLDADDEVERVVELPSTGDNSPNVAWRMTEWPGVGVWVSHQRASNMEINVGEEAPPNGYGAGGGGETVIVEGGGSGVDGYGEIIETSSHGGAVLPVDAAVREDGAIATVAAGSDTLLSTELGAIDVPGEPIAVRFRDGAMIVQTREPSRLVIIGGAQADTIELDGDSVEDAGHALFHRSADGPTTTLSCASCHPEGGEDAHVWSFTPLGPRRTQSLLRGVGGTEPFHWDGDLPTFDALLDEVFTFRMGNRKLSAGEKNSLATWLDGLRPLPSNVEGAEIDAGRAAFEKAGCDACHGGEDFTNDGAADVGTGGVFQVPSLAGLRFRAPYMHDGCAPTIADRFGECGGDARHGDVGELSEAELTSLIDFLERL